MFLWACLVWWRLGSIPDLVVLIVFACVDAEFFIHSSEKGALIILVCVIILSLAKKVAVVN